MPDLVIALNLKSYLPTLPDSILTHSLFHSKVPYTGPLKLSLAREWCRRTDALAPEDTQRFAARTTLGNALSASGAIAEAIDVVRGNLEVVTGLQGEEHPHTLGTTMNLGILLHGQGKVEEASTLYTSVLEVP